MTVRALHPLPAPLKRSAALLLRARAAQDTIGQEPCHEKHDIPARSDWAVFHPV
jgi:hypothetical protein